MDVSQLSHEVVVDMIRKSGELVSMTVVGLSRPSGMPAGEDKPGSPASMTCDSSDTTKANAQNHFATLPRKYSGMNQDQYYYCAEKGNTNSIILCLQDHLDLRQYLLLPEETQQQVSALVELVPNPWLLHLQI